MKLIIGLGNPGEQYLFNRHSVGFMFLDEVASNVSENSWDNNKKLKSKVIVHNSTFVLAKPQTFMNKSGMAVAKIKNFYNVEDEEIYIAHDDLDIELGEYKIHKAKGPREHKGIISVEVNLGSKDFWRIRIGVDNRNQENRIPGDKYVLQDFLDDEAVIIQNVLEEAADRVINIIEEEH